MRFVDRPDPSAATAVGGTMHRQAFGDGIARSPRGTWVTVAPIVTAALALATLAAVPWAVSWRLANVRLHTAESITPARQLVPEIAAALALEVAARDDALTHDVSEGTRRYREAVAIERSRDSALGALAPRLGGRVADDIARLRALTAQWHAERQRGADESDATLPAVVAAAARLDSALDDRQARQSARIRSLETLNVLLPSVLVPLLAVVLIAIYWTGRRMAALATEAERSRLALAVASEHKVTLLRGLTHDLKNALGAASGFATLLREEVSGPLTTQQRDHVARIGRIIEHTMIAVEDALVVARTEAGALPVRLRQENLRALVLESASDYVAAAERARLTITVEVAEDLPPVDTDPSLVTKIIANLLSNAIKYTPADGRIWLRAFPRPGTDGPGPGPWVVVEVCDTGPGVPVAFCDQVFDEFFRAPTATTTARGEGIGLAMSRRVARLLGGEITLYSEEGRGAAFVLWLPAPAPADVSAEASSPGDRPPGADGKRGAARDVGNVADGRHTEEQRPHRRATESYDRRRAVPESAFLPRAAH